MKKNKANFLDYIPVISDKNKWSENDGMITIHMTHRGIYAWIAQKVFHRPHTSHIALDEHGSFVWQQIDGKNTVGDIAEIVKIKFGDDAEPLYPRLVKFMQILCNNKFIIYRKEN